jgi:hypothetical protein
MPDIGQFTAFGAANSLKFKTLLMSMNKKGSQNVILSQS